jgi:hypothetical protein
MFEETVIENCPQVADPSALVNKKKWCLRDKRAV